VAAVFSLRISADTRQEVVGGADVYAPVCRQHYVQLSQVRQPEGDA
jgi:thymidine kinase